MEGQEMIPDTRGPGGTLGMKGADGREPNPTKEGSQKHRRFPQRDGGPPPGCIAPHSSAVWYSSHGSSYPQTAPSGTPAIRKTAPLSYRTPWWVHGTRAGSYTAAGKVNWLPFCMPIRPLKSEGWEQYWLFDLPNLLPEIYPKEINLAKLA